MSMISEQVKQLRLIAEEYRKPPYGMEVRGTVEALCKAADTIETLSAKLAKGNMERSERYYNGGWILCSERLPKQSLNSVIGWDDYRKRCCFVQYYSGKWHLAGENKYGESVKITAWMPVPKPYKPQ